MTLQKSQVTETGERISISIEIKIKKNNEFSLWARYWEHRDEYDIGPAHIYHKTKVWRRSIGLLYVNQFLEYIF